MDSNKSGHNSIFRYLRRCESVSRFSDPEPKDSEDLYLNNCSILSESVISPIIYSDPQNLSTDQRLQKNLVEYSSRTSERLKQNALNLKLVEFNQYSNLNAQNIKKPRSFSKKGHNPDYFSSPSLLALILKREKSRVKYID